jgi:TonB-linked SusC/RagA family outer membrane protein
MRKHIFILCLLIVALLNLFTATAQGVITETQELSIDSLVNIQTLNIGYGTASPLTSTESVSFVKGSDIPGLAEPMMSNLLSGQITGLIVMHKGGEPGTTSAEMYIRGKNTYNSNSAMLVFVDGFESSFDYLLPSEIETITILKDAAALAVYGMRGANGVMLVTTKRGAASTLKVNVNFKAGVSTPLRMPQFLDSYGYASLYNEAVSNDLGTWTPYYSPTELDKYINNTDPNFYPNVNWFNEVLSPANHFEEVVVSMKGGNASAKYFTLIGYTNTPKLYKRNPDTPYDNLKELNEYSKYNVRSNIDININKVFSLAVNVGGAIINSSNPNVDNLFTIMNQLPPNAFPVYNDNGSWAGTSIYFDNPLATLYGKGKRSYHSRYLQTDFSLAQNLNHLVKGLSLKESISFFGYSNNGYIINKDYERYQADIQSDVIVYNKIGGTNPEFTINEGESTRSQMTRSTFSTQADYNRTFGKHAFNATVGAAYSKFIVDGNNLPYLNAGIFGRIAYNFDKKYLSQLSFAYNGSENLPKNKKYGLFPALGLGWVLSEEDFLSESGTVDFLKLRASAGMVGSSDLGTTRFGYQTYYVPTTQKLNIGSSANTSLSGLTEGRVGNPDITYERNYKYNVGIDAVVIKSLSIKVDGFYESRTGILATKESSIPSVVAILFPYENIGSVINRGVEVELSYSNKISNLQYALTANFSYAKSKITYQAESVRPEDYLYRTGQPVGQIFGLEAAGLFNSWEEINNPETPVHTFTPVQPGDIKYKDQNGDGYINENDEIPIGYSVIPQLNAALNLYLSYKGFDLSASLYAQTNRSVMLSGNTVWSFYKNGQAPQMADNRWAYYPDQGIDTRESAIYPRLTTSENDNNYRSSSFWLRDASFARLQNFEIGYTFTDQINNFLSVESIRLFTQATNIFTISAIKEFDPEVLSGYPLNRSFAFGLNVQF